MTNLKSLIEEYQKKAKKEYLGYHDDGCDLMELGERRCTCGLNDFIADAMTAAAKEAIKTVVPTEKECDDEPWDVPASFVRTLSQERAKEFLGE